MKTRKEIEAMSEGDRQSATGRLCNWQISAGEIAAREAWFDTTGEWLEKDCYMPKYLHDLNAMHEAEKVMPEYAELVYVNDLVLICCPSADRLAKDYSIEEYATATMATARQRNTAFLMVML